MAICGNGQYPFIYRWFSKFVSPFSWGISHWHVWSGLPRVAGQWCILRCTLRTFGSATSPLWPLCWGFFSDDLSRGAWNQIAFPRRMVISHSLLHIESYFNLFQSISIYFILSSPVWCCFNAFYVSISWLLCSVLLWVLGFRPERVPFVKVQNGEISHDQSIQSIIPDQFSIHKYPHSHRSRSLFTEWILVILGRRGSRSPVPDAVQVLIAGLVLFSSFISLDHRLHVAAAEHESGQVKAAPGRRMVSSRAMDGSEM